MAFNIIGGTILLLAVAGMLAGVIGLINFTDAFQKEYASTTYHMADTATALISGDHLEDYLRGERIEEYKRTKDALDEYCRRIHVSLVYVIQVDQSDYGRFVSVFNSVDNSVDDTSYTPWEAGYRRDTTNEEYALKYKAIYEEGSPYETIYRIRTTGGAHAHITAMVPVKGESGDVRAILCMQRPIRELLDARRPYLRDMASESVFLILLAGFFGAFYMRRRIVTPIADISKEAKRFASENTLGKPLGRISNYKEIADLAASIDTMETDMVQYIADLTAATAERERLSAELNLASQIQMNSVPNDFPAFPEHPEIDIFASMSPAKEVGGDFYNFFPVDEDHIALVIGDVSGKGIPAALFMMVTNIMIRDRARMGGSPAEILAYVNRDICANNKLEMFVSVWLGILELSTGRLLAANAGHEYPAVRTPEGVYELYKDKHGLVVGAMDGISYKDYEIRLQCGSQIFVYTDGVPEATDAEKRLFGTDRMIAALNEEKFLSPRELLERVRGAVDDFVKDAEQFDDLTMLCLAYNPNDIREERKHDDEQ